MHQGLEPALRGQVASFLGDGVNNEDANGDFVRCFDQVFIEERDKDARYRALLSQEPHDRAPAVG